MQAERLKTPEIEGDVPLHIAIVMDGNRRWAKARGILGIEGHKEGARTIEPIAFRCRDLGVQVLSFYTLSIENLSRPPEQVGALLNVLRNQADKLLERLDKDNIRFKAIGDLGLFPLDLQSVFKDAEQRSAGKTGMIVNLALGYSGADEVVRAVKKIIRGNFSTDDVTPNLIKDFLDTSGQPDPELVIRTGRRSRLSGFFPLQSMYSEIFFSPTLWPDFTVDELNQIIAWYRVQTRTFGR